MKVIHINASSDQNVLPCIIPDLVQFCMNDRDVLYMMKMVFSAAGLQTEVSCLM